ncbi:MAG: inositol monophosphatase [Pseudomonadota bacterium]
MVKRLPSPEQIAALLEEVAADEILPRFNQINDDDIIWKLGQQPVTQADLATERVLRKALKSLIPGSIIVGEEGEGRSIGDAGDQYIWLIDPVDGTRNFIAGRDHFCSMIALVSFGQTVLSAIHAPIRKKTAICELGGGAFYGGEKLDLAVNINQKSDVDVDLISTFNDDKAVGQINFALVEEPKRSALKALAQKRFLRVDRLRCAGLDLVDQARGIRHFSVYRRLWSWDHAPGVLLLTEAGGVKATLEGFPSYDPLARVGGLVTATEQALMARICDMMYEHGV